MAAKKVNVKILRNTFVAGELVEKSTAKKPNVVKLDESVANELIAAGKAEMEGGRKSREVENTTLRGGQPIDA